MELKKSEIWGKKTILQPIEKSLNHFINKQIKIYNFADNFKLKTLVVK